MVSGRRQGGNEHGHPISEASLKGIAVEPDGSFAYVTGYGDSLTDRTKSKFSIWRISIASGLGESQRVINFDSKAGASMCAWKHRCISQRRYPTPHFRQMHRRRQGRDVTADLDCSGGSSLYVPDAIGGRILNYDKASGDFQSTISGIPVACGVAIAPNSNIWVGHEHTKVSVYSPSGVRLATPITDLTEVRALSIQGNTLAVADRVGKIRKYTISDGTQVMQTASYGLPERPGDRKPQRLSSINGMALDVSGNILVSDRLGDGSRLQKSIPSSPRLAADVLGFPPRPPTGGLPDLLISS
jgi:hypothetical protein